MLLNLPCFGGCLFVFSSFFSSCQFMNCQRFSGQSSICTCFYLHSFDWTEKVFLKWLYIIAVCGERSLSSCIDVCGMKWLTESALVFIELTSFFSFDDLHSFCHIYIYIYYINMLVGRWALALSSWKIAIVGWQPKITGFEGLVKPIFWTYKMVEHNVRERQFFLWPQIEFVNNNLLFAIAKLWAFFIMRQKLEFCLTA
jgi:hypothetical protein